MMLFLPRQIAKKLNLNINYYNNKDRKRESFEIRRKSNSVK